jgi:hypothetical protein
MASGVNTHARQDRGPEALHALEVPSPVRDGRSGGQTRLRSRLGIMCRVETCRTGAAGRRGRPRRRSPSAPPAARPLADRASAARQRTRPLACRQGPRRRPPSAATAVRPSRGRDLLATAASPDAAAPPQWARASPARRSSARRISVRPRTSRAAEYRSPPPRAPPDWRQKPQHARRSAAPTAADSRRSPDRSPADETARLDRWDEPPTQARAESRRSEMRYCANRSQTPRRPRPKLRRSADPSH